MMKVKNGDTVKVEYVGTFDDGTVFDSSKEHGQLLSFEVGAKQVIPGFDTAVVGMEVGQEKKVTILPEEAYGHEQEQLKQTVPREHLPPETQEGSMLMMALPDGQQIPVKVVSLNEKDAVLNLNHPLAGKTLHFDLTLKEIN